MHDQHNPCDRRPEEYVLFALTFAGLGMAASGIVITSPALCLTGVAVTLVALLGFVARAAIEG